MPREFGGPWTEIKLDVLKQYLNAYTTALKNQPFERLYIDAFAGTGKVRIRDGRVIDGSAQIALETPGFDRYIFIEQDETSVLELDKACEPFMSCGVKIDVERGNANEVLFKAPS